MSCWNIEIITQCKLYIYIYIFYDCMLSHSVLSKTLCNPMDCSTPGLPVPHHLPKFAQVHVHCIGDAVQPSHSLMPSSRSALIFPNIRDFSNESSVWIRWPKYWSFRFSISEYSGLVFKTDWFDLLAVQGTFRTLLQHHSSKASILRRSASLQSNFHNNR